MPKAVIQPTDEHQSTPLLISTNTRNKYFQFGEPFSIPYYGHRVLSKIQKFLCFLNSNMIWDEFFSEGYQKIFPGYVLSSFKSCTKNNIPPKINSTLKNRYSQGNSILSRTAKGSENLLHFS